MARAEEVLRELEDLYSVLVTIDYPDAITGNLRRSTDVARSLIEKTRGDLSIAFVQRDLHDALDRHAREPAGTASRVTADRSAGTAALRSGRTPLLRLPPIQGV